MLRVEASSARLVGHGGVPSGERGIVVNIRFEEEATSSGGSTTDDDHAAAATTSAASLMEPAAIVLVLDMSTSMRHCAEIVKEAARSMLNYCFANRLAISIVPFNRLANVCFETLEVDSDAKVAEAMVAIERMQTSAGTNVEDAIRTSFARFPHRRRTVLFLSDGLPAVGELSPLENHRKALAFADSENVSFLGLLFGIESGGNYNLFQSLAASFAGMVKFVKQASEIETAFHEFVQVSEHIVARSLQISWESASSSDSEGASPSPSASRAVASWTALTTACPTLDASSSNSKTVGFLDKTKPRKVVGTMSDRFSPKDGTCSFFNVLTRRRETIRFDVAEGDQQLIGIEVNKHTAIVALGKVSRGGISVYEHHSHVEHVRELLIKLRRAMRVAGMEDDPECCAVCETMSAYVSTEDNAVVGSAFGTTTQFSARPRVHPAFAAGGGGGGGGGRSMGPFTVRVEDADQMRSRVAIETAVFSSNASQGVFLRLSSSSSSSPSRKRKDSPTEHGAEAEPDSRHRARTVEDEEEGHNHAWQSVEPPSLGAPAPALVVEAAAAEESAVPLTQEDEGELDQTLSMSREI